MCVFVETQKENFSLIAKGPSDERLRRKSHSDSCNAHRAVPLILVSSPTQEWSGVLHLSSAASAQRNVMVTCGGEIKNTEYSSTHPD